LHLWVRGGYEEYDQTPHFRVLREQWRNDVFHEGLVIHPWYSYDEVNPAIDDPWTIRQNENQFLKNEIKSFTAHLTYDAEAFTVKYIGGHNDWDWAMHYDGDGVAQTEPVDIIDAAGNAWSVPVAGTVDSTEVKDFQSHELQLLSNSDAALDWVVGLYYYHEDVDQAWDWRTPGNEWLMNAYLDGSQINWWETGTVSIPNPEARGWYQGGTLDADSIAVFGQIGYDVNERWKINAGLRYTEDKKSATEFQSWWWMPQNWWEGVNGPLYSLLDPDTGEYVASSITSGPQADEHKQTWDAVTGMFSFEYRPDYDTLWYLSVSQGFKSGGFRLGAMADVAGTPENESEADEETMLSYELGYKADLTDNLRVNAAAYFYDYSDMQSEVWVRRGSLSFLELHNAHKAEAYGLELEALARLGEFTSLNLAASFARSELTDFCGDRAEAGDNDSFGCLVNWQLPGEAYDPSGNDIPEAPEVTWAANLSHNIPVGNGVINMNATHAYVGSMDYHLVYIEGTRAPSYNRTDFNFSYTDNDNRYRLSFYVKNAFDDERPTVIGEDGPQYGPIDWAYYSYPRIYGAEVQFNW
jgi:iron complex outermembrane receptor protein